MNGNPLTEFATRLVLKVDVTNDPNLTGGSFEVYDHEGKIVDKQMQEELRTMFTNMTEEGRKMMQTHPSDITMEEMLKHTGQAIAPNRKFTATESHFIEWLKSGMEGWDNSDLSELSAKSHYWEHDAPLYSGGDGFIADGFYNIVNYLAKDVQNKILLSHVVKKIENGPNQVKVVTNQGVFSADYAICTLPLGVLKAKAVEFSPPLPKWKETSIERIGFGLMNKLILEFPYIFWNAAADGLGYVSNSHRGEFGFFLHLHHLVGKPVIVCFVAAEFAKKVEKWTDKQILDSLYSILNKIYGKEKPIPKPIAHTMTRWGSDPYARGSYAFMKVNSTTSHLDDLAKPVGRLHFAGEGTAKYPGYTHGAYLSALREVELIQKKFEASKRYNRVPTPQVIPSSTQLIATPVSKL